VRIDAHIKHGGCKMNRLSQVKHSRAEWKSKAIKRGDGGRYWKRQYNRVVRERNNFKKVAREAQTQLAEIQTRNRVPVLSKNVEFVQLSLELFCVTRIGFRAIARVIALVGRYFGFAKTPCPQTVINWVLRLSIVRMHKAAQMLGDHLKGDVFSKGSIWMIDASIGLGAGKILNVLALSVLHHKDNSRTINFQDVSCVGVSVKVSWTGEAVAAFVQRLISVVGRPAAFLKDGGTELAKAGKLLDERGFPILMIDDISHVVANLLKHEYKEHPQFDIFISACGAASKKLKQTVLACLAPPKVSTRARFMNLHRLVRWAGDLLKHSPVGRVPTDSLQAKLRVSLGDLPQCRAFISRFHRDATALLECQKILKTNGLSEETWAKISEPLMTIPANSAVHSGLKDWGKQHIHIAKLLGVEKIGLPITSDQIESVFAVAKQHGVGEIKDVNRIGARIPALCGGVTPEDAANVLDITVAEQEKVFGSLPSLVKQRRQILPNPGSLDQLASDHENENLELLPRAKSRANNHNICDITDSYNNGDGPKISTPQRLMPPPKTSPPSTNSVS